ncbi:hypothetical protein AVEN_6052-1 [Araneus ventricosus]|uniref:Uncharacterized protein n=1 Tax=Araneus ventricosus TaxID=182803 RepID=A0A4Y2FZ86_ARAVE|nr:hypothetical protein AVEN_6052-1 [Araneus ventricosus]
MKLFSPHRGGSNHVYTPSSLVFKSAAPVGQGLYHFIVPNKSRPPHAGGTALSPAGPLLALNPSRVGRARVGIFGLHQRRTFGPLRMI